MTAEHCSLSAQLSRMHLAEKSAISLETPDPEYVLHLDSQSCAVCGNSAKLAASSTNRTVRLYSRANLANTSTIAGHEQTITGVKFCKKNTNLLFTSSMDGTIRCWDLRMKSTEAAQVFEGYEETNNVFASFDLSCDGRVLCAGTEALKEDVHLIFWDTRTSDRLGVYSESHQEDITQVSFHPSRSDVLLSGSMDGLVCVFDISEGCEDDALTSTLNTESAVHRVGWSGAQDELFYAITTTNSLHVWDLNEFDPVVEIPDINDKCLGKEHMDYLVDCFHGDDSDLYILAGTNSGNCSIYRIEGQNVCHQLSLDGGHSEVVRCLSWDKENQSLITGGEDAMLCLWKPGKASQSQPRDRRKAQSAYKSKKGRLKFGKIAGSAQRF